jgi:hypothetical protein
MRQWGVTTAQAFIGPFEDAAVQHSNSVQFHRRKAVRWARILANFLDLRVSLFIPILRLFLKLFLLSTWLTAVRAYQATRLNLIRPVAGSFADAGMRRLPR